MIFYNSITTLEDGVILSLNHHLNVLERFECPHESQEQCCLEPCAPVGSPMANWSRGREQTKNGSRAERSYAPQSVIKYAQCKALHLTAENLIRGTYQFTTRCASGFWWK